MTSIFLPHNYFIVADLNLFDAFKHKGGEHNTRPAIYTDLRYVPIFQIYFAKIPKYWFHTSKYRICRYFTELLIIIKLLILLAVRSHCFFRCSFFSKFTDCCYWTAGLQTVVWQYVAYITTLKCITLFVRIGGGYQLTVLCWTRRWGETE